jgi:hypothetical protein
MNRNFREYALLGIMAAIALQENRGFVENERSEIPDFKSPKRPPPIPKGCKRYWFDKDGRCFDFEILHSVYDCIALSEKRAIDKFNKIQSK